MAKKKNGLFGFLKLAYKAFRIYSSIQPNSAKRYGIIIKQLDGILGQLGETQNQADTEIENYQHQFDRALKLQSEAIVTGRKAHDIASTLRTLEDTINE